MPRFCISDLPLLALSLEKVQSGPKTTEGRAMKTIFAILLMSVTSFAFAQEPPHDCSDRGMGKVDPECKKGSEDENKNCPNKPVYDYRGSFVDYLGRLCGRDRYGDLNQPYCIKVFDEKTKKDVYHWSCSEKPPANRQCTGKAVRSCHELKGDECTASFVKGNPGAQCGLHSDGTCSNSGGECNG